jgi:uncharacterized membrane protein
MMAGVFGLYAHTIMRGLRNTDDRAFVTAFQAIDKAIINPVFMLTFFGALISVGVSVAAHVRPGQRLALPWIAVALGLYLLVMIITFAVHLPLNDAIKTAGDPSRINDIAAVRQAFHETRWATWNIVRFIATTAAAFCLTWSLVLHGRATAI